MRVTDRPLPQNLQAERCVLGAILLNPSSLWQVVGLLENNDWYERKNRIIWTAIYSLRDEMINLVALTDRLATMGRLEEVGGPAYIVSLVDGLPRSASAEHYAKIVKEKSTLRNLIASANKILKDAYDVDSVA